MSLLSQWNEALQPELNYVYTPHIIHFFFLKLCVAKAGDLGLASEKEAWCVDLLTLSDKYLSKVILQEDGKFKTVSSWKKV